MFNTVWPRAAAAAERLWSPQSYTDVTAALPRLEVHLVSYIAFPLLICITVVPLSVG